MESKTTVGPWVILPQSGEKEGFCIAEKSCNWDICTIRTSHAPTPEQATANANLIAAAPELLAALEQLARESFVHCDDHRKELREAYSNAKKAISKAKGEAQNG